MLEKEQVRDFLHSLNSDLDEVRGRLLGLKRLPTISKAFAEVLLEESRKRVMRFTPSSTQPNLNSRRSALAEVTGDLNAQHDSSP